MRQAPSQARNPKSGCRAWTSGLSQQYTEFDRICMQRALDLAQRGCGFVEPNPMVGCVIARRNRIVAEGWHGRFGGPHAEVEALRSAADAARGATAYVTLEPCCHHGKTPPCSQALLDAGIQRVVVGLIDPLVHPSGQGQLGGQGIQQLRQAGLQVEVGLLQESAADLTAPYRKLIHRGRPWVIAKWAMTLDGRISSRSGHSQWISNVASRRVVHTLRGRVDAIVVGSGTVLADNPRLTARPPGPRAATRVVLDSRLRISIDSELVRTANQIPVLVAVDKRGDEGTPGNSVKQADLQRDGCELLRLDGDTHAQRWHQLLDELGRRQMTNILVEGGSHVLGSLRDCGEIDEVHVFIAPKLLGGRDALCALNGLGAERVDDSIRLRDLHTESLDGDLYVWGRTAAD